jgi:hypothetical protein
MARKKTIRQCSHSHKVAGMMECDFSRSEDGQPSQYSAQVRINICASCGLIQFYREAHRDVCAWLVADSAKEDAVNPFADSELRQKHRNQNKARSGGTIQ